jgi:hypothetical protein
LPAQSGIQYDLTTCAGSDPGARGAGAWWGMGSCVGGVVLARVLAAATIVACVVAAACGGGEGDGDSDPTPTATEATGPGSTIENGRFISFARGYSVTIPPAWSVDDDFVVAPDLRADGFFSPEGPQEPPQIQPTILVQCETSDEAVETAPYAQERIATVGRLGALNISEPITIEVGGVPAVAYEYDLRRTGGLDFHRVDVMWGRENCGWLISLSTSMEDAPAHTDLFTNFVNSFAFVDDAGA